MIGNIIKYWTKLDFIDDKAVWTYEEGLVVDSFTKVEGKSESSFGFGEGKVDSNRMYKVEYSFTSGGSKFYKDIRANQLVEILEFKGRSSEEEKFVDKDGRNIH